MLIKTLSLSLLTLAAGIVAAQAQITVLDNFSNASGNSINGSTDGKTVSEAFMTGGTTTTLADVMFPQLQQGPTASTYYYNYLAGETFSLYSSNVSTGLPLLQLVNLNLTFGSGSNTTAAALSPGVGQTMATVPSDATSQAAATLLPNTKYWLVLNSNSTAAVSWDYNYNNTYVGSSYGYSIPGGTIATVTHADNSTASFTNGAQQMYISIVPEPSTYCLMAVAGLALVVSRKRKAA